MMPYYYGYHMGNGYGVFMILMWIVVLIDLILLGLWLWKQIKK